MIAGNIWGRFMNSLILWMALCTEYDPFFLIFFVDGESKDWIGTLTLGILCFGLVAANLLYFGYRYYRHSK